MAGFKRYLREHHPAVFGFLRRSHGLAGRLRYRLGILRFLGKPVDRVFSEIYRHRRWGEDGSVSGPGSTFEQTEVVRGELPRLVRAIGARSILDAPCGDFHWMRETPLDLDLYIGADIVPELIERNSELFGGRNVEFRTLDITKDPLPRVDLIICRDCLVHLSLKDISRALSNFMRSGSSFLLTTTYPGLLKKNRNIISGDWRPIDLELPPFDLPAPLAVINEKTTEPRDYPEKSLALWQLDRLEL